ncbi:MAG: diguanylate cyclase, partial [Spirochaetales bacterium]|nr:diguanylate cyclase [Spirochaetales bacterium]
SIRALRSRGRQRLQSIVIALGGGIPIIASLGRLTGLVPEWFDPSPLSFAATGALTAFGMFKLGLVEIVPAARELAIDALRDGFVVTDTQGAVVDANRAARSLLGWDAGLGSGDEDLRSAAGGALSGLLSGDAGKAEVRLSERDGAGEPRERHIRANAYPILSRRGEVQGLSLLLVDQTETVELLDRLKELADKDGLTGLLNRRRFLELASREIALAARSPRPLALILADVDHFKRVNDRHGHEAGDAVLMELSRRLVATLRNVDLVGRYGGEEFVMLLSASESVRVELAAERARRAVADRPVSWNGLELRVSMSFGCASVGPASGRIDASRVSELLADTLRRADAALYRAKEAGRNRVETAG